MNDDLTDEELAEMEPEWVPTARYKQPPITAAQRAFMHRTLSRELRNVQECIIKLETGTQQVRTDETKRQLYYWQVRVSVLKDLLNQNKRRRGYGKVS